MSKKKAPIERPVAAAARTLQILDAFARTQRPLSLIELADETGLFKSVILRYMISLEDLSFVVKREDGRYQVGTKVLRLGRSFEKSMDQREVIETAMKRLVQTTGESVFFYVCDGDNRMCVMGIDSPHVLRVTPRVGVLVPMDSTSISLVLRDYGAGVDESLIYDSSVLRATEGEYDELTSSISVPIFKSAGAFLGSLSVSGPSVRFDSKDERNQEKVLAEGRRLSTAFGFGAANVI